MGGCGAAEGGLNVRPHHHFAIQIAAGGKVVGIIDATGDDLDAQGVGGADQIGQQHAAAGILGHTLNDAGVDKTVIRVGIQQQGNGIGHDSQLIDRQRNALMF